MELPGIAQITPSLHLILTTFSTVRERRLSPAVSENNRTLIIEKIYDIFGDDIGPKSS